MDRSPRRLPQRVESTLSVEAAVSAASKSSQAFCRGSRVGCNSAVHARDTRAATARRAGDTPATTDWLRSIDYHYFALIWPIGGVIHQSSSNWILPYVIPLFRVTFAAPKYVIKESRLPEPLLHHRPRTSLALVRQPTLKEQNRDHLGRKDARDQA